MNIAVTIDDNYVYPLSIMLSSLFSHHKEESIHIWLLHSRVSKNNVQMLGKLCKSQDKEFTEICISEHEFADAPVMSHFTKEMYYRILIAKLLPDTLDRILYLDPDIVILDSLNSLYHMPLEGVCFAGVKDRFLNRQTKVDMEELLGIRDIRKYVNSGVLLCNLKELRGEDKLEEIYDFLHKKGEIIQFPDQDIINVIYEERIALIDDRYNLSSNMLTAKEFVLYNFLFPFVKKPAIVHYMGPSKPWNKGYTKGLYHYYWMQEFKAASKKKWSIGIRIFKIPFLIILQGFWNIIFAIVRVIKGIKRY